MDRITRVAEHLLGSGIVLYQQVCHRDPFIALRCPLPDPLK